MPGGIGPLEHALGNPSCELLDALRLVAIASELLVERERVEALEPRFQGHLPVGVPEELRVPEPADDDALGVLRDEPLVARPRVHDGEERLLQLSALVEHRKIVLMVDERRRQYLVRQLEERRRVEARDDSGELHQIGHFLHERVVVLQWNPPAQSPRVQVQVTGDAVATFGMLEHDEMFGQPRLVFLEAADLDRTARAAARGQKAVTVGQSAGLHVLDQ